METDRDRVQKQLDKQRAAEFQETMRSKINEAQEKLLMAAVEAGEQEFELPCATAETRARMALYGYRSTDGRLWQHTVMATGWPPEPTRDTAGLTAAKNGSGAYNHGFWNGFTTAVVIFLVLTSLMRH